MTTIFHVEGQGAARIFRRARGERLADAKDRWTKANGRPFGQRVPFPLADFFPEPRSPQLLRQRRGSASVETEKSPTIFGGGNGWPSTPALSSARTRPAIPSTCARREGSTSARTRRDGGHMFPRCSEAPSPPARPPAPRPSRRAESREHVFSESARSRISLAYLGELPLRLLLLRGVDRRPQQLRELTRVHRSGLPQLACV